MDQDLFERGLRGVPAVDGIGPRQGQGERRRVGEPTADGEDGGGRHRGCGVVAGQRAEGRHDVGRVARWEDRAPGGQQDERRVPDEERRQDRPPHAVRDGDPVPRTAGGRRPVVVRLGPRRGARQPDRGRAAGDQRQEQQDERRGPERRLVGGAGRAPDGRHGEDPRHCRRGRRDDDDEPAHPPAVGVGLEPG